MRSFQPFSQQGFARILAETRTHYPLSPGLISIEQLKSIEGYSAFFNFPFPPSYSNIETNEYFLEWILPEKKKEKALAKSFTLSNQPFYPSYMSNEISSEDFTEYAKTFSSLPEQHKQIFTLPLSWIDSPIVEEVIKTDVSLIALTGLPSLFNNQRKLTEALVLIRTKLPPDIAIYLPGHISPELYTFLVYAGIDFFDNSIAYFTSKRGYFLTSKGTFSLQNHPSCYCKDCMSSPPNIFGHNETVLKNTLAEIRFALNSGTFRSLVEQDIHNSITFAAALRQFDRNYSSAFRLRTPVLSSAPIKCVGEESLFRPEIVEFRERVKKRFIPDSNCRIVILLPCSARKPYSFSRSHMLFRKAVKEGVGKLRGIISELIITSPLAVVPRELENIYPAKSYDIPVAGQWNNEEIEVTTSLLLEILSKYSSEIVIINHTHGEGYNDIVENIKNKISSRIISTSQESSPTSNESLSKLTSTLKEIVSDSQNTQIQGIPTVLKQLRAVADYQYGNGVGKTLFNGTIKIKGKYPRDRQIFRNKEHIANIRSKDGFLTIQPQSAQEIVDLSYTNLEFGDERVSGSNIYAPGCLKADKRIHPNDDILVVFNNQVIATGTAVVSGEDMNKMTSGILAGVRKKYKVKI
ncbi:MAG: DUF5591 domain-containing protein [Candidatus Heimdallarchaeota archaeon]|nr:DUF5591 domain-containing protein [Candidatus Heimdallarchaeota archaeon]MCK4878087.1 DUF5591 domain-containing protein [Candidatus Heimdallarchaeota archaeon]